MGEEVGGTGAYVTMASRPVSVWGTPLVSSTNSGSSMLYVIF